MQYPSMIIVRVFEPNVLASETCDSHSQLCDLKMPFGMVLTVLPGV